MTTDDDETFDVHRDRLLAEAWEERDALQEHRDHLLELLEGKSRYVDCICPGCPRKVPEAWASGMCEPCATEDCEHTVGAKEVAAERDKLREDVEALKYSVNLLAADNKRLSDEVERLQRDNDELTEVAKAMGGSHKERVVERDRLSAVLAETPENVEAVAREIGAFGERDLPWVAWEAEARAVLADRRAKAGIP